MKIFIPLLLLAVMQSCNFGKASIEQAKKCVESYFTAFSNKDFEAADEFYSAIYLDSESKEERKKKMVRLFEVLGPVSNYQLLDSTHKQSFGEPDEITLVYKVQHEKVNTKESYTIINDEGTHKIISQSVENQ